MLTDERLERLDASLLRQINDGERRIEDDTIEELIDQSREANRLRAEVEAMSPVVDAAVAYGMSPSDCHRSESLLVEVAGMYHASKNVTKRYFTVTDLDDVDYLVVAIDLDHAKLVMRECTSPPDESWKELTAERAATIEIDNSEACRHRIKLTEAQIGDWFATEI